MNNSKNISIKRAEKLKSRIFDYLNEKPKILSGLDQETIDSRKENKRKIMNYLNASEADWNSYEWQLSNRIDNSNQLGEVLNLSPTLIKDIEKVSEKYRWSISPYYLSLIGDDFFDPIKLQSIPTILENIEIGEVDPMAEEYTNPAGVITRRYPDRLIIKVTNTCAMFCRHCQRRRNIGSEDNIASKQDLRDSFEYIRNNPEIRDVLITGGDPLTLTDSQLDWILSEIRAIPHVEIIRIGTRTLVTMPQRITENLVDILKKYHPLYINTHFNHSAEITPESKKACEMLSNVGIPLGNQAVLLNGINNDKFVMEKLNQQLLMIRVKPYYLFHAKHVIGTTHFNTSIEDGLEIMEYLRGRTSGMAIPTYIVNAPLGQGKTPMLPKYLLEKHSDYYKIRTWEGVEVDYENHPTIPLDKQLMKLKEKT